MGSVVEVHNASLLVLLLPLLTVGALLCLTTLQLPYSSSGGIYVYEITHATRTPIRKERLNRREPAPVPPILESLREGLFVFRHTILGYRLPHITFEEHSTYVDLRTTVPETEKAKNNEDIYCRV